MEKKIESLIKEHKIIAILRGVPSEKIVDVAKALYDGGIRLLEITLTRNPRQSSLIHRTLSAQSARRWGQDGDRSRNRDDLWRKFVRRKRQAHPSHLLLNVDETVIKETVACGLESIPGAMTPSEIADAYRYGASVVKLFPAGNLGLSYCKAVMAPINNVPMIAVGGVDDKNLPDFLKAGFIGLGIGSSLTNKKMIEEGRYDELKVLAEVYVKAAEN